MSISGLSSECGDPEMSRAHWWRPRTASRSPIQARARPVFRMVASNSAVWKKNEKNLSKIGNTVVLQPPQGKLPPVDAVLP
ncbi:unnamed protein product, partial [Nesidiocoris tenuis]